MCKDLQESVRIVSTGVYVLVSEMMNVYGPARAYVL